MTILRLISLILTLTIGVSPCFGENSSAVTASHLLMIESLLRDNGLEDAGVALDSKGRVQLKGRYRDSREVNRAFSLAQSVAGVKWTSPVAPEDIEVRDWAKNLSMLFPASSRKTPASAGKRGAAAAGKFALVVGVSRFKNDPSGRNSLKYAADDAAHVKEYLVAYRGYRNEDVTLLVNEKATLSGIRAAVDELAGKAGSGDEVFLYFSSHGAPVYDGSLNVVAYDTRFKNHFTMSDSSFPSQALKRFIQRVDARTIVVLDVCYSGAAFKGIEGFYHQGAKSIAFDDDNQGFSGETMAKTLLGAKDIELAADAGPASVAGKDAGAKVIISASDAGERSWESDSIRGSFFTHHLLEELRSGKDLQSAFQRTKPRVTSDVRREKKAEQNPQSIASRKDWGIR